MFDERGWAPIETAPRDGTRVLLSGDTGPNAEQWTVFTARYSPSGWVTSNTETNYGSPIAYHPTHWRPIQKEPEDET